MQREIKELKPFTRILLVSPDEEQIDQLEKDLFSLGISQPPCWSASVGEAVDLLFVKKQKFNLVMLDYELAQDQNSEFVKQFRQNPDLDKTILLLVCKGGNVTKANLSKMDGADEILIKPWSKFTLSVKLLESREVRTETLTS